MSRRRLCRCAFGMAAAIATLQPERQAEFEASHRPCAPGKCDCQCFFCRPDLADAETASNEAAGGAEAVGAAAADDEMQTQAAVGNADAGGGGDGKNVGADGNEAQNNMEDTGAADRIRYF